MVTQDFSSESLFLADVIIHNRETSMDVFQSRDKVFAERGTFL
jgi:hypothetical protein